MDSLGKQIIAELFGCDQDRLDDVEYIRWAMTSAARKARAQIVTQTFHHFSPYGVSGAVIITDSHLAIHTWPEYGYAAVDLFTCSGALSSKKAVDFLCDALKSQQTCIVELPRGPKISMRGDVPAAQESHLPASLTTTGLDLQKLVKIPPVTE